MLDTPSIIFLPWGSYEQHGPLLPNNTDIIIAEYMANALSSVYSDSIVLPVIPFGLSQEHLGIGHTITSSLRSTLSYIEDLLLSIGSAYNKSELIVIVNGHGGNQDIGTAICSQYNYKILMPKAIVVHVFPDSTRDAAQRLLGAFGAHADSAESSVLSAIDNSIIEGEYLLSELNGHPVQRHTMRLFPVKALSENGIVTHDTKIIINREKGRELIRESIEGISFKINQTYSILKNGEME